jgi:hypothetical protein
MSLLGEEEKLILVPARQVTVGTFSATDLGRRTS